MDSGNRDASRPMLRMVIPYKVYQLMFRFAQAQIVNEECEGTKACEIKPILGACPPPVPLPPPRRKPKPHDQPDDIGLQSVNRNGLG